MLMNFGLGVALGVKMAERAQVQDVSARRRTGIVLGAFGVTPVGLVAAKALIDRQLALEGKLRPNGGVGAGQVPGPKSTRPAVLGLAGPVSGAQLGAFVAATGQPAEILTTNEVPTVTVITTLYVDPDDPPETVEPPGADAGAGPPPAATPAMPAPPVQLGSLVLGPLYLYGAPTALVPTGTVMVDLKPEQQTAPGVTAPAVSTAAAAQAAIVQAPVPPEAGGPPGGAPAVVPAPPPPSGIGATAGGGSGAVIPTAGPQNIPSANTSAAGAPPAAVDPPKPEGTSAAGLQASAVKRSPRDPIAT